MKCRIQSLLDELEDCFDNAGSEWCERLSQAGVEHPSVYVSCFGNLDDDAVVVSRCRANAMQVVMHCTFALDELVMQLGGMKLGYELSAVVTVLERIMAKHLEIGESQRQEDGA